MYEQFFGLTEKPFSIQPDPSFLYWGRTHRLAYAMLEYGVLNHAGISVITGEVGCGKTTLVHRLLDQLSDTHTVTLLSNIQEGRGDLLSWVLMGFGQSFAGKSHVEMFSQLQSFFIGEYAKGKRIVLIIDEAQNLSMDMLEELRMLSNINAGKDQLLQLILVGQPELKGLLNRPELLQLAQRVGSDFHLTPLNNEEVHAYIETRLSIAGCRRRIFTDRAIDLIAEQSRGVPRVINIVADTALVYAFSAEDLVVGVETIRNVIRDKTDYGVFGLASDDAAAPPVRRRTGKGPDAFIEEAAPEDDAAPSAPRRARPDSDPPPPPVRKKAVQPKTSPKNIAEPFPTPAKMPVAKAVSDVKSTVRPNGGEKPEQSKVAEKVVVTEESSITGVVVVGAGRKTTPEAAIRSAGDGRTIVFVAIGNTPDAITLARRAGAIVVEGGERLLTTGGRARNAGYRQLKKIAPHLRYVQFIDADSVLDPDWISAAERFMNRRPEVTVVEGREKSQTGAPLEYRTIAEQKQREIDGEIQAVSSGSALIRADAFETAGGFRGDLVASEIQDLCVRLRRRGGHIWRLENNMQLSDSRSTALSHWWSHSLRRGFQKAYCASLHGGPPERLGVVDTLRSVIWGFAFPIAILIASGVGALGAALLAPLTPAPVVAAFIFVAGVAIYAAKILSAVALRGIFKPSSWRQGFYAVMGRFPEFLGVARFWLGGKRPSRSG